MYALSMELFGVPLRLQDFPVLKSVRGIGLSDAENYAAILADRFHYRNTFFDRPPRMDISAPAEGDAGSLDFLVAAEVFEHVRAPVEQSFRNALSLLREGGVMVMSVPYTPDGGGTEEHFPELADYGLVSLRGGAVLVNRTEMGEIQVFDGLIFHGGHGSTLEMRCFSEAGLRAVLAEAGFGYVRIYGEDCPQFGVVHEESWSLPIGARRVVPSGDRERFGELAMRHRESVELGRELERTIESLQSGLSEHREWVSRLQEELARAQAATRVEQAEIQRLQQELVDRSEWAKGLDRELAARHEKVRELDTEVEKRTAWARGLEGGLAEKGAWAARLDKDVRERTAWAQDLERQLAERTDWAKKLDARVRALEGELESLRGGLWNRLGRALRVAR